MIDQGVCSGHCGLDVEPSFICSSSFCSIVVKGITASLAVSRCQRPHTVTRVIRRHHNLIPSLAAITKTEQAIPYHRVIGLQLYRSHWFEHVQHSLLFLLLWYDPAERVC
jgi:hypothetical protein